MGRHPGVELRESFKSIFHRCHLCEVAFVWELAKETIDLPLGCLEGGGDDRNRERGELPPYALESKWTLKKEVLNS